MKQQSNSDTGGAGSKILPQWRILVPLLAGLWLGSVSGAASQENCGPSVGFTLTHWHVDASREGECLERGAGTAETRVSTLRATDNIVQSYADPKVRAGVKSDITQMVGQGATAMRTILWYYLAEDQTELRKERNPSRIGMVEAVGGKLPDAIVSNLVQLISDAKSAGIRRYIVSMGGQGAQNPKCRQGGVSEEWGNCYDPSLFKYSWGVTEQVVKALKSSSSLSGIDVLVDVASESCFDPSLQTLVDRNLKDHASRMIEHYRDQFGDHQFITSCGGGRAERTLRGLEGMEQLYASLRTKPAAVDMHVYDKNSQDVLQMLETADALAKKMGIPLEIGETNIDHPNLFTSIASLRSRGELSSLRDVLVFPRRATSNCQIDVQAPYNIGSIRSATGLRPQPSVAAYCGRTK